MSSHCGEDLRRRERGKEGRGKGKEGRERERDRGRRESMKGKYATDNVRFH